MIRFSQGVVFASDRLSFDPFARHRLAHFPYEFRDIKDSESNVANRPCSRILKITKADQKLPSARSCFWKCCGYDMRLAISPNALWWLLECPACELGSFKQVITGNCTKKKCNRHRCENKRDYVQRRLKWSNKRYERLTIIWKTRYDPSFGRA